MQSEFYPFQSDDDRLYFDFLSVSPEKTIRKAVFFSQLQGGLYRFNLALVDILPDGRYCDITVSNNHDIEKVLGTVAKCIEAFFEHYPSAQIYIKGSTSSRTRLYRIIFSRELPKLTENYEIYGSIDSLVEPFELNGNYTSFILKLKKNESTSQKH
jgi:hypothetical protein